MRSPLKWLGGKSRLAGEIVRVIPPHRRYAEVFAGAGWVFFAKHPARHECLNDINGDLIAFYRVLQNHLEEFCRQFKWLLSSRELFNDSRAQMEAGGLTDIQRAARFYYLQRQAFAGKCCGRSFGVSPDQPPLINLLRLETELSEVHLRLCGVVIENLDWREFIRRYDGAGAFMYLDPPYHGTEGDYGAGLFRRADFAEMAGLLSGLEAKWLLSINDVPEIRDVFGAFCMREVTTMYSAGRERPQQAGELLIANYDLADYSRPSLLAVGEGTSLI
jgi:DNA adenine methylase